MIRVSIWKEKKINFYDSTNRSTIRRFDRRYKRKKLYFYDSNVVIKEKKLYFYDSMIRWFDRRYKRKKIIFLWFDDSMIRSSNWKKNIWIFMIRRIDRRFEDSIDNLNEKNLYFINSTIRWFDIDSKAQG
jgi:hypothetical protein